MNTISTKLCICLNLNFPPAINKLACLLILYGSILICKGQPTATPEGNLQVVNRYYQLVSNWQFEQLAEVITADALLL